MFDPPEASNTKPFSSSRHPSNFIGWGYVVVSSRRLQAVLVVVEGFVPDSFSTFTLARLLIENFKYMLNWHTFPPPARNRDGTRSKLSSVAQIYPRDLKVMGVYRLSWKDISSQNLGITYHTYHGITLRWLEMSHRTSLHCAYHGINLLWLAAFHRTSLLWLVCHNFCLSVTSLNIM